MSITTEPTSEGSGTPKQLQPIILNPDTVGLASKFRSEFDRLPKVLNSAQVIALLGEYISQEQLTLFQSENYGVIIPVQLGINNYGHLYTHDMIIKMLFAIDVHNNLLELLKKDRLRGHDFLAFKRKIAGGYTPKYPREKYKNKIRVLIEAKQNLPFVMSLPTEGANDDGIEQEGASTGGLDSSDLEQ